MCGRKKCGHAAWSECDCYVLVLSLCFLLGGLIGCLFGRSVSDGAALDSYLRQYTGSMSEHMVSLRFLPMLFDTLRIPVLVFLLSLSFVGFVGIPCIFAVRGFCLCLCVSCFVDTFGLGGTFMAFVLFGLSALVSIPALFLLGVHGLRRCRAMSRSSFRNSRGALLPEGAFMTASGISFVLVFLSSLIEFWIIPLLLPVAERLL